MAGAKTITVVGNATVTPWADVPVLNQSLLALFQIALILVMQKDFVERITTDKGNRAALSL